jgi:hypothetical protein
MRLADAVARMRERLEQTASTPISYRIAGVPVSSIVSAVPGRTPFVQDDGHGVIVRRESRDYLISAAQVGAIVPAAGHRIVEGSLIYEVTQFGDEPCWRWSDPYRTTLRIHTNRVAR